MATKSIGRVLIIAGSDSGGGAGIQGDIKTVSALGGYAMTAITALTAQNTQGVFGIHPVPEAFIAQQIDLCLSDIGADAIKTGMLHSARVIETVAQALEVAGVEKHEGCFVAPSSLAGEGWDEGAERVAPSSKTARPLTPPSPARGEGFIPLVVDPVMVAKGGAPLLEAAALTALKTLLIPRATIITPNLPEAALLLGKPIGESADEMIAAGNELLLIGCNAVLLKGGHARGERLFDVLVRGDAPPLVLEAKRIETRHTHGTGCAMASAIATGLAQGLGLEHSVRRAHGYVQAAIAAAPGFGQGHGPLGHWVMSF